MVDRNDPIAFDTHDSPKVLALFPSLFHSRLARARLSRKRGLSCPGTSLRMPGLRRRRACIATSSRRICTYCAITCGGCTQGVGIHAMEVYFPRTAVKQTELEK